MSGKHQKQSISIRIPSDYYEKLKVLALANKRPLVSELVIILDDYLKEQAEFDSTQRLKVLSKITGIVKGLPKRYYGRTVDKELYGD